MTIKQFNWQIGAGFLLSLVASLAYPFFFVNYPITRDFPWATLVLYAIAIALVWIGLRRAFNSGGRRSMFSQILASGLAALSVVIIGLFLFSILVFARWLPPSSGAPKVGQRAPDFTLSDASGKQVSLSQLLTEPIAGQTTPPKGVLLIFYRGYW